MLENLRIDVHTPYSKANIDAANADLFIIGNCASRTHPEVESIIQSEKPYSSFPALIGNEILSHRHSIVVTGTHGKTTTSSLIAHSLKALGYDPGFLIGGLPKGRKQSFALGSDQPFVIEGDEYDTAFFDKGSKFLHYRPKVCVINNIEFDHADIFADFNAVLDTFAKLCKVVEDKSSIVANIDDSGVLQLLKQLKLESAVTKVSTTGAHRHDADVVVEEINPQPRGWSGSILTKKWGRLAINSKLFGSFNFANIAQLCGVLAKLEDQGQIAKLDPNDIISAIASFPGVHRRMELLAESDGVMVFEDFAHHPTAVREVIRNARRSAPDRRLIVAFEPKSASSRRNVFFERYAKEFTRADMVLLGRCADDPRLDASTKMDTERLARNIGPQAKAFDDNDDLYGWLKEQIRANDSVIFMSPGNFSGIHQKLAEQVNSGQIPI